MTDLKKCAFGGGTRNLRVEGASWPTIDEALIDIKDGIPLSLWWIRWSW
ncbi:hypothetical protein KHA80_21850 [Anaerobacillus sp. HL2]|nr:hypothetical protein KHA80_21850 [Anaerobacillus sp. HL2]